MNFPRNDALLAAVIVIWANVGALLRYSTMHCCIYGVRYTKCLPVLSGPSSKHDKVLSMQLSLNSRCTSFKYVSNFARRCALMFSGIWSVISDAAVCGRGEYLNEYELIYFIFSAICIVCSKSSSDSPGKPTIKSDEICMSGRANFNL